MSLINVYSYTTKRYITTINAPKLSREFKPGLRTVTARPNTDPQDTATHDVWVKAMNGYSEPEDRAW